MFIQRVNAFIWAPFIHVAIHVRFCRTTNKESKERTWQNYWFGALSSTPARPSRPRPALSHSLFLFHFPPLPDDFLSPPHLNRTRYSAGFYSILFTWCNQTAGDVCLIVSERTLACVYVVEWTTLTNALQGLQEVKLQHKSVRVGTIGQEVLEECSACKTPDRSSTQTHKHTKAFWKAKCEPWYAT